MHSTCIVGLALLITYVVVEGTPELGCEQQIQGCRIQLGQCLCGIGCSSDYIYETKAVCQTTLRGRRNDSCQRNPCLNGGSCSQITISPGFKCRCEGTGYYGARCHIGCPRGSSRSTNKLPFECIVI